MKFRTDFVTNSSSSSFSVTLSIESTDGNTYSLGFDPYEDFGSEDGGNFWFSGNLPKLLIDLPTQESSVILNETYPLKDVAQEGRNERIERVQVGDAVELVVSAKTVDVRNAEGSLGILPATAARLIIKYAAYPQYTIKATVSSVTPLSARAKTAKSALISVAVVVERSSANRLSCSSVEDLCRMLTGMIRTNVFDRYGDCDWDEDEDSEYDEFDDGEYLSENDIEENKRLFVKRVAKNISSVQEIARITVEREYSAWGECADLVADNDRTLCELAKRVIKSRGEVRAAALKEMERYIHTSNPNRVCEEFGSGYDDFRYQWYGDEKALLELAKRLTNGYGPGDVSGREVDSIDTFTGEYTSYAEFDLK